MSFVITLPGVISIGKSATGWESSPVKLNVWMIRLCPDAISHQGKKERIICVHRKHEVSNWPVEAIEVIRLSWAMSRMTWLRIPQLFKSFLKGIHWLAQNHRWALRWLDDAVFSSRAFHGSGEFHIITISSVKKCGIVLLWTSNWTGVEKQWFYFSK